MSLYKAVGIATSINRMTSAIGATIFVLAGIYQLYEQLRERRARKRR